jgi:DNA-3-methyladenine glycosylase II
LPLDTWADTCPADEIRARLLAVRGIGPWTVNYTLLRGFGWPDGSLHGDVAVRRGLQLLLGRDDKINAAEAEDWLAEFSPWRALVAAHLWALKSAAAY